MLLENLGSTAWVDSLTDLRFVRANKESGAFVLYICCTRYLSPPISRANFPLHAANSICNSTVAPNTNRIVDTSFLLSNECTLQAEISRDLRDLCSQGLLLPWLAGYNECKSPYENYEKGFLRCSIRSTGKDVLNNFERRILA